MTNYSMIHISVLSLLSSLDGSIALTQRLGDDIRTDYWDLPGGRINPGEKLFSALNREITEEIGLAQDSYSIESLLQISESFYPNVDNGIHSISIIYQCSINGKPNLLTQVPYEVQNTKWLHPDDLIRSIANEKFTNRSQLAFKAAGLLPENSGATPYPQGY